MYYTYIYIIYICTKEHTLIGASSNHQLSSIFTCPQETRQHECDIERHMKCRIEYPNMCQIEYHHHHRHHHHQNHHHHPILGNKHDKLTSSSPLPLYFVRVSSTSTTCHPLPSRKDDLILKGAPGYPTQKVRNIHVIYVHIFHTCLVSF